MRRADKEMGTPAAEDVLRRAFACRIALSVNDRPYIVTMNFVHRNECLYLHSAREGRKIDMIRANDRVCFQAECDVEPVPSGSPCGWGVRYRSAVGTGRAVILSDGPDSDEKREALRLIAGKYAGTASDPDSESMEAVSVIRIDIDALAGKKSGYAD